MDIASSLQVGFMLRALLSCYSAVVTDFCLGRHLLTSTTLQTVIEHCKAFDKDPWTGPVSCDGRPVRAPLANTASAGSGEPSAAYNAMEQISFNYHFSRWRKCFSESSEKCLICYNFARGNRHSPLKCPILKKLGLKLEKCLAADNSNNSAACIASDNSSGTATTPAPAPAPASNGGPTNIAGTCTASTEAESYNSGGEFDYKGKYEGLFYARESKPSKNSSLYLPVSPSCSHSLSKISYNDPQLKLPPHPTQVPLVWLVTLKALPQSVFLQMSWLSSTTPHHTLSRLSLMPIIPARAFLLQILAPPTI
jgi:hypothetical protein